MKKKKERKEREKKNKIKKRIEAHDRIPVLLICRGIHKLKRD